MQLLSGWMRCVWIEILVIGCCTLTQSQVQAFVNIDTLSYTATDCLRFVIKNFEVISQSASHIYHSALPLAPPSSIVQKLYGQEIHSSAPKVVTGVPASWDSCTASVGSAEEVDHAVWSPCCKFVAANFGSTIEVRDSKTLESVSVLKPPIQLSCAPVSLAFSSDGSLLACSYL